MMTPASKPLTTRDVARILGLSDPQLRMMRSRGYGPRYYKYGRTVVYEEEDVLAYRQGALRIPPREAARLRSLEG